MTRLIALLVVTTACSTPPLTLALAVSTAASDSCGATTCNDIPMACQSVASIRILDPNTPLEPYIHMCVAVTPDRASDLCSLASINLDQVPLPVQTLEVQVVVFPRSDVVDPVSGDLVCPADVVFDAADGFPTGPLQVQNVSDPSTTHIVRPAIGGRAFYHPGDAQVVVDLGCPDLGAVNDASCSGDNTIAVTASVLDFDNQQPLPPMIAELFTVSVGEPKPVGTEYTLAPANTRRLGETVMAPDPAWGAGVDLVFTEAACLEVLEDVPEATSTLTCETTGPTGTPISMAKSIDLTGFRLATPSLQQILAARGSNDLTKGLVVGVVLDDLGNPAPNFPVSVPTGTTVKYLSADRASFGGSKTTTSGIFISEDAPFGTTFTTSGAHLGSVASFGGLVDGKVTIVVLQFAIPSVGG